MADRPLARCGAWYEMFPRSQGDVPGRAATLREAERRLPAIRDLGFDIVYLAPIHPIGHTHRKGPNNTLTPLTRQSRQSVGDRQRSRRPYGGRACAWRPGRFRSLRSGGPTAGTGGRDRLRDPMLARPSVGARASGMVPASARRFDQVCGESAQGVPGHLSARFRGTGGRSADGSDQGSGDVLDRPRRADFPGRQPAYQAGGVCGAGLSERCGSAIRTRSSWPRRLRGPR